MSETPRKWLKQELKLQFVPKLLQLGFQHEPISKQEDRDTKSRNALGLFKRRNDRGIDRIDITLGEAPRAEFSIDFATVPYEGMTFWVGNDQKTATFYSAEDVWSYWGPIHYVICWDVKKKHSWWGVRRWPWQKLTEEMYAELVAKAADLVSEIEVVYSQGIVGPHIRCIELRTAGQYCVGRLMPERH